MVSIRMCLPIANIKRNLLQKENFNLDPHQGIGKRQILQKFEGLSLLDKHQRVCVAQQYPCKAEELRS